MYEVHAIKVKKNAMVNYAYVVVDDSRKEAIIVDPGYEYAALAQLIEETGSSLKAVLLTHHHSDHAESASLFAKFFDVPVFISGIEREFYNFHCVNIKSVAPDSCIYIGGFEIYAFHTPGHTKGSVCWLVEGSLFTGDTLFVEGCGICSEKGGDPVEMYGSLKKLRGRIEPLVCIYPGHSFGAAVGALFSDVLQNNIYMNINSVEMFVTFRMRSRQLRTLDFQ